MAVAVERFDARGAADGARDQAIPSGARLRPVRGAKPGHTAAVEVLAEHEIVFPPRLALQP
jgi:hypothetical protein